MKKISVSLVRSDNAESGNGIEYRNFDIVVKNSNDETAAKIIDAIADEIDAQIKDEWDVGECSCIGCPSTFDDNCGIEYRDILAIELVEDYIIAKQIEDIKRFYKVAKKKVLAQYN